MINPRSWHRVATNWNELKILNRPYVPLDLSSCVSFDALVCVNPLFRSSLFIRINLIYNLSLSTEASVFYIANTLC